MCRLYKQCIATALVLTLAAGFSTAANAQVVTVAMNDSNVVLTGRLISETDTTIVLQTRFGQVSIERDTATCRGCGPVRFASLN